MAKLKEMKHNETIVLPAARDSLKLRVREHSESEQKISPPSMNVCISTLLQFTQIFSDTLRTFVSIYCEVLNVTVSGGCRFVVVPLTYRIRNERKYRHVQASQICSFSNLVLFGYIQMTSTTKTRSVRKLSVSEFSVQTSPMSDDTCFHPVRAAHIVNFVKGCTHFHACTRLDYEHFFFQSIISLDGESSRRTLGKLDLALG